MVIFFGMEYILSKNINSPIYDNAFSGLCVRVLVCLCAALFYCFCLFAAAVKCNF